MNPIIKGLDNGYLYTKDNENRIFKSAYSRTDDSLMDKNKIIIDGTDYYFGNGNITSDTDKTNSEVTKVCTLANIAMTNGKIQNMFNEYYLVVGLPIEQYKSMKDRLRCEIMKYNTCEVTYGDNTFRPNIKDVTVFAQGAGAVFSLGIRDGEYISFDIGSYTINVVLVEICNGIPHIIKFHTWYDGILTLYSKIIKEINRRYELPLDDSRGEKILQDIAEGRGFTIKDNHIDTKFIDAVISDYLDNISSKFNRNYDCCNVDPILLSGGGAYILKDMFNKRYVNSILLQNSQFANAQGYYKFGLQKYSHLIEKRIAHV